MAATTARTCECPNPLREDDGCVKCGKTIPDAPAPQVACHCGQVFEAKLTETDHVACPDCQTPVYVPSGKRAVLTALAFKAQLAEIRALDEVGRTASD